MGYICIFESKTHWSNEPFVFWRFSSEILPYKTDFIYSSFPAFSLPFPWSYHFKHLSFCHRLDLFHRNWPFACFFFPFLLDHVGQNFGIFLLLSIHQICRDGSILDVLDFAFGIFLFMGFDSFFHLNFFFKPFSVENLGLNSSQCFCFFGYYFCFPGFFLSSFLLCVQPLTESLLVQLHVIILRHSDCWKYYYNEKRLSINVILSRFPNPTSYTAFHSNVSPSKSTPHSVHPMYNTISHILIWNPTWSFLHKLFHPNLPFFQFLLSFHP